MFSRSSIAAMVVMCGISSVALAGELDQACQVTSITWNEVSCRGDSAGHIQTFTVGQTGTMDAVGLQVRWDSFPDADLEVYIHETTADTYHIVGNTLASLTVPYSTFPQYTANDQWITVLDLDAQAFEVTDGQVLGIRLAAATTNNGSYVWAHTTSNDDYLGGQRLNYNPSTGLTIPYTGDFGFQTFVTPEPASFALLSLGGLAVLRRRR